MLRAMLLLCGLSCAGCSYAFVHPPPADHARRDYVECTSSRLAPVLDVGGALELGGSALMIEALGYGSTASGSSHDVSSEGRAVQVAALGLAGLEVASAAYGFRKTAECDRAEEQWQLRVARRQARPGCKDDTSCKSGRRCVQGLCMWPQPAKP